MSKLGLNFVTESNCVLVRGGGEQPQVNDQSVTSVNSIRPAALASLRLNGEAPMVSVRSDPSRRTLNGRADGGWRRNGRKVRCREEGIPVRGFGLGSGEKEGVGLALPKQTWPAVGDGTDRSEIPPHPQINPPGRSQSVHSSEETG